MAGEAGNRRGAIPFCQTLKEMTSHYKIAHEAKSDEREKKENSIAFPYKHIKRFFKPQDMS